MKYGEWVDEIQNDIRNVVRDYCATVSNEEKLIDDLMKQFFLHMIFRPELEEDAETAAPDITT